MIGQVKAILLDIEGTTTPIDFVHKTLFPYSRKKIASFVRDNIERLSSEIQQLRSEYESDQSYKSAFDEKSAESIAEYLNFLIDQDRKSTPLKSIQGKIWHHGYEAGDIRSLVFDDVPEAFARWTATGMKIAIYSSGSTLAQRDLFKHTNHGDLTPSISAYFDTTIGGKKETESYQNIARESATKPETVLFISDVIAELDAARGAGMQTVLSVREGNTPVNEGHTHLVIHTFDELDFRK